MICFGNSLRRVFSFGLGRQALVAAIFISSLLSSQSFGGNAQAADEGLLGPLWHGQAHFQEVGSIAWDLPPYNSPQESSGWLTVRDGKWFIFNRRRLVTKSYCGRYYAGVVARESSDQGKTWSNPPVTLINPSPDTPSSGCEVLDGSTFFDPRTHTWHLLAQCMASHGIGGWSLCHFTRADDSPMGPFIVDPHNPVVPGGALWSRICSGVGKACDPNRTVDEGTPEILALRDGYFYVTFHGVDRTIMRSYRGVARTRDFDHWEVSGGGLPDDAMLSSAECASWTPGCVGPGESTTLITGDYQYVLFEGPDKSLACTYGQAWNFGLVRTSKNNFPKWNGGWEQFPQNPVLTPSWEGPETRCGLQYARWILDGNDVYLLYEDIGPGARFTERRLLKLVPGPASPVALIRPPSDHR
jgi:hypothetical protein